MLVRGTVVALGEWRALARLALARRGPAAGDAAVEGAGLDLALDEGDRRGHPLAHRPGDLSLARDREVAPNVLEERPVRLREVERILGQPLHRLLAGLHYLAAVLPALLRRHILIDQIFYRPVDGA